MCNWTTCPSIPGLPGQTLVSTDLLPSLQVIDHSGARLGEYEDVSQVEKYKISQEAYDQRQGMEHTGVNGGVQGPEEVCAGGRWCPGGRQNR